MVTILVFWFTGAAITCAIMLTVPNEVYDEKTKRIIKGKELNFASILVIVFWPYYMVPALARVLKDR